jgi:hypothetical protein
MRFAQRPGQYALPRRPARHTENPRRVLAFVRCCGIFVVRENRKWPLVAQGFRKNEQPLVFS